MILIHPNPIPELKKTDQYYNDSVSRYVATLLFAFLIGGGQRPHFYQLVGRSTKHRQSALCFQKQVKIYSMLTHFHQHVSIYSRYHYNISRLLLFNRVYRKVRMYVSMYVCILIGYDYISYDKQMLKQIRYL